jgi:hypothetical protein
MCKAGDSKAHSGIVQTKYNLKLEERSSISAKSPMHSSTNEIKASCRIVGNLDICRLYGNLPGA